MPFEPGTAVGPYTIVGSLGAGGMGVVYRARDTRLKREVALKVLPDGLAKDLDRVARFQREAELLATLNHPTIAAIYGLEEDKAADFRALVMELVEGETLADRIARGPLSIDEAIPIARQIADALDYAHEHGVLHRDLKPANIKVTPDGQVKVLDFGLAKALDPTLASAPAANSPTFTSPAFTQAGVLLGTAAYMSPEQARGRAVDKRADIWAFGCVLFEMLTGRCAFEGETISDTLAGVLRGEPDWARLPASTPGPLRGLLRRCLARDVKERLRDIGDARHALEAATGGDQAAIGETGSRATDRRDRWTSPSMVAGLLLVAAVAGGSAAWSFKPTPAVSGSVRRWAFDLPGRADSALARQWLTITRDGSQVLMQRNPEIWIRKADRIEPKSIEIASLGSHLALSPDEQWLAFWSNGEVRKVPIGSGPPVTVTRTANDVWGLTWSGNQILFGAVPAGIMTVPDSGGDATVLVAAGPDEWLYGPQVLPGGNHILFTVKAAAAPNWDAARIVVHTIATGVRRVIVEGGRDARYVPSGHLVYARGSVVFAQPFDTTTQEVRGGPIPVVEGVAAGNVSQSGAAHFAVSDSGVLVYAPPFSYPSRLVAWRDRQGRETPLDVPPRAYASPRLDPAGVRVLLVDQSENDFWMWSSASGAMSRLTSGGTAGNGLRADWTSDGRHILRGVGNGIVLTPADGSGADEVLAQTSSGPMPFGTSPDGLFAPFLVGADLFIVGLKPPREVRPLIQSPAIETGVAFHPTGRWIAYQSTERGPYEVFVRPFPDVNRTRWAVSSDGGTRPLWSPKGDELFYVNARNQLVSVAILPGDTFATGRTSVVFEDAGAQPTAGRHYDISRDGSRFLMLKDLGPTPQRQVIVVENWFTELNRLVPPKP